MHVHAHLIGHSKRKGSTGLNSVLTIRNHPRSLLPLPPHLLEAHQPSPALCPVCTREGSDLGLHITAVRFPALPGALLSSISNRRQWTEALGRDLVSVKDIPKNMLEGVSRYRRLIHFSIICGG